MPAYANPHSHPALPTASVLLRATSTSLPLTVSTINESPRLVPFQGDHPRHRIPSPTITLTLQPPPSGDEDPHVTQVRDKLRTALAEVKKGAE